MLDAFLIVPAMAVYTVVSQLAPTPQVVSALMPDRFEARVGEQVSISLESAAGVPLAWADNPSDRFFVRVAGRQDNRERAPAPAIPPGGAAAAAGAPFNLPLEHAGLTMICINFEPAVVRLAVNELRALLDASVTPDERDKVLKDLPADKPVRVRIVRCAKSFVHVLPAPGAPIPPDAQTSGSKSGQVNEIRLLLDPFESVIGGDITVRLHADIEKAARARATAVNLDSGKAQEFISDPSGIGFFHLDEPGRWKLAFATARRLANDPAADVVIYSASATFAATRTEMPK